eukprot:11434862-Heterocapsa_arctica.AAC.1
MGWWGLGHWWDWLASTAEAAGHPPGFCTPSSSSAGRCRQQINVGVRAFVRPLLGTGSLLARRSALRSVLLLRAGRAGARSAGAPRERTAQLAA